MPAPVILQSYSYAVAIVTSNTVNFVGPNTLGQGWSDSSGTVANPGAALCDAIWVGSIGGGAVVRVVLPDGRTVDFTCIAGEILPVRCMRVNSTGTTASSLVALYA